MTARAITRREAGRLVRAYTARTMIEQLAQNPITESELPL